jgi:hypothetical protein
MDVTIAQEPAHKFAGIESGSFLASKIVLTRGSQRA